MAVRTDAAPKLLQGCRNSPACDAGTAMVQLPAGLKVPRSPSSPVGFK
jgi:hypothetical protein